MTIPSAAGGAGTSDHAARCPAGTAHSLRSRAESGTLLCAVVVHDAGPRAA
jgi:hypothetical protein